MVEKWDYINAVLFETVYRWWVVCCSCRITHYGTILNDQHGVDRFGLIAVLGQNNFS